MFDALWTSQALEAAMLVCFGVAWPLNLLLMLRHRRPEGKGMPFTVVIASGYVCGATAKVLLHLHTGAALQPVFWLYVLNALSVAANVAVQIHFRRPPRCPGTPCRGSGRLERLAP
jgi:hypothetical protein